MSYRSIQHRLKHSLELHDAGKFSLPNHNRQLCEWLWNCNDIISIIYPNKHTCKQETESTPTTFCCHWFWRRHWSQDGWEYRSRNLVIKLKRNQRSRVNTSQEDPWGFFYWPAIGELWHAAGVGGEMIGTGPRHRAQSFCVWHTCGAWTSWVLDQTPPEMQSYHRRQMKQTAFCHGKPYNEFGIDLNAWWNIIAQRCLLVVAIVCMLNHLRSLQLQSFVAFLLFLFPNDSRAAEKTIHVIRVMNCIKGNNWWHTWRCPGKQFLSWFHCWPVTIQFLGGTQWFLVPLALAHQPKKENGNRSSDIQPDWNQVEWSSWEDVQ